MMHLKKKVSSMDAQVRSSEAEVLLLEAEVLSLKAKVLSLKAEMLSLEAEVLSINAQGLSQSALIEALVDEKSKERLQECEPSYGCQDEPSQTKQKRNTSDLLREPHPHISSPCTNSFLMCKKIPAQ